MFTRERLRNILRTAGILALVLAVMPYHNVEWGRTTRETVEHLKANPEDAPRTEEYRFGWSDSPLVQYRTERRLKVEDNQVKVQHLESTRTGIVSWSSFTLLMGVGILWLSRFLSTRPSSSAIDASS